MTVTPNLLSGRMCTLQSTSYYLAQKHMLGLARTGKNTRLQLHHHCLRTTLPRHGTGRPHLGRPGSAGRRPALPQGPSQSPAPHRGHRIFRSSRKILRDELNLGKNTDLSGSRFSYVKLPPGDKRFSYKMPTGNEGGAYKGEWVPGGLTKSGTSEGANGYTSTIAPTEESSG